VQYRQHSVLAVNKLAQFSARRRAVLLCHDRISVLLSRPSGPKYLDDGDNYPIVPTATTADHDAGDFLVW